MDIDKINQELKKVQSSSFASKTDKQLIAYQLLSDLYNEKNKGIQPEALRKYNNSIHRRCKLTYEKAKEIREKYNPHLYGKHKLAKEYGVSPSVILRIIKGKSWKVTKCR